MLDSQISACFKRGQPDVYDDSSPPILPLVERAPGDQAGAGRAKQDLDLGANYICPDVRVGRPGEADALVLEIVCPQHAVASAKRAIACGDDAGIAVQRSATCSTKAAASQRCG